MAGRFIVLEGIDGSGKSSLAARLGTALRGRGRDVVHAREPGGTPIGEQIRGVLLDARNGAMVPGAELFLYMACRAQLVDDVIRPALQRGAVVLLDRYYYSTAAYQGAAGKVGIPAVLDLAERVARFPKPDRVLLLDLDPAEARRREGVRNDRVESKGLEYQRKVRAAFKRLARREARRFVTLDASRSADEVFVEAWKAVQRAL
jgi:dTMP kinase